MDAAEFIKERNRMCMSFSSGCNGCPAFNESCCAFSNLSTMDAKDQVGVVEKWSIEHPRKTRLSVFLERYPEADVMDNGLFHMCPKWIDKRYNPCEGCAYTKCDDCEKEYWMQEV